MTLGHNWEIWPNSKAVPVIQDDWQLCSLVISTVEFQNKGNIGNNLFVLSLEVVPTLEACYFYNFHQGESINSARTQD